MYLRHLLPLAILLFPLSNLAQPRHGNAFGGSDLISEYRISYLSQETGISITESNNLLLYDTISTWLGTPYKFAGNCEKGIDCSGFINVLCDRVYGVRLGARSSSEIYNLVQRINKEELQEGDLVFFSTRKRRISHIGLYLNSNKFVHASTSRGVIISDLDEEYYKRHFAGAGRLKGGLANTDENH